MSLQTLPVYTGQMQDWAEGPPRIKCHPEEIQVLISLAICRHLGIATFAFEVPTVLSYFQKGCFFIDTTSSGYLHFLQRACHRHVWVSGTCQSAHGI